MVGWEKWATSSVTCTGNKLHKRKGALEDGDSSPPCMGAIFRCMGKAARSALCAIVSLAVFSTIYWMIYCCLPMRYLRQCWLRPILMHPWRMNGKGPIGVGKPAINGEIEKGLLTLIASDNPRLQVCDP